MQTMSLDQLIGLTPDDLDLLKVLGDIGAATAEEVALKMDRPGDDFTPQIDQPVKRQLVETRVTTVGEETFDVYILDPLVRNKLNSLMPDGGY